MLTADCRAPPLSVVPLQETDRSITTLALAAMLYAVSFRWTEVTGGENGLGGITRPTLFGFNLESSTNYYWFVAIIAFAALILLTALLARRRR